MYDESNFDESAAIEFQFESKHLARKYQNYLSAGIWWLKRRKRRKQNTEWKRIKWNKNDKKRKEKRKREEKRSLFFDEEEKNRHTYIHILGSRKWECGKEKCIVIVELVLQVDENVFDYKWTFYTVCVMFIFTKSFLSHILAMIKARRWALGVWGAPMESVHVYPIHVWWCEYCVFYILHARPMQKGKNIHKEHT